MSLWSELVAAAEQYGDRAVYADSDLDYARLVLELRERATSLAELGVTPGARVALFAPNSREFLEASFVVAALGAILVPLNLRLSSRELRGVLEDAQPVLVLCAGGEDAALRAALGELHSAPAVLALDVGRPGERSWLERKAPNGSGLPASIPASSVAQLYYTSGTTGRPKGVPLTHGQVSAHAAAARREFELSERDVWGHFAPMFHLADAWATFAVSFAGGRHSFLPRFSGGAAFDRIHRDGVTVTNMVPTMLNVMLHEDEASRRDLSSMRLLLSGGAPIAPELVQRLEALFGCAYAQTYGLTETSPYLTVSLPTPEVLELSEEEQARARARTGRPFGEIELKLVDDQGLDVPSDDESVGEILARGPWVFSGYWERPDETAAAFSDGWFRTGDLATRDAYGSFRIVDRKKDVILSGGETVYSTEVENALYTHQLVREAAVFGVPDEHWGEVVAAAVVRIPGGTGRQLELEELIAHCRLFLAGYKVPRRIAFLEELPKTGSGKIQKRVLRERLLDGSAGTFTELSEGAL
jgi:acyl-CoA synthetase (AMP-forming)/AMP-acid ligase II